MQLSILAENKALLKWPSKAPFTLKVPGVIPSKGEETAQQPLMQPSQDPWPKVLEHSLHNRAAEVPGVSQLHSIPEQVILAGR